LPHYLDLSLRFIALQQRRVMKTRLLIYALLGLIVTMTILFGGLGVKQGLTETAVEADYMNFRLGGTLLTQGHSAASELYDPALQSRTLVAMIAPVSTYHFPNDTLPFVSVPLVAALAQPVAALPVATGFVVWNALQVTTLLLSLWLLGAMLPLKYRYLLWLGAFSFLPLYQSLIEGQVSPMLVLGVTLLWRGLRAGGTGNWWGGAGLALCLLKPQMLPLFLLYMLYKRNWRAFAAFIGTSGVVYLLSALIAGWGWLGPYINILNLLSSQGDRPREAVMFHLTGLLARFGIYNTPLLLILTAIIVAALLYAWWRSDYAPTPILLRNGGGGKRDPTGMLELQLAATTLAAVLTSVHLYPHDLTMLLFSGAVLLGWAAQRGWPAWVSALLLVSLITPFTFFVGPPIDGIFIIVMLVAFAGLIYFLARSQGAAPTD
jgi:Glycosyltransferase family 87